MPSTAPHRSARPLPLPSPSPAPPSRISMRAAARRPGGEGGGGIAAQGALWAALASAGDHLLAVNASPARLGRRRGNGGRGIKERVRLGPGRGGRVGVGVGVGVGAGAERSLSPPRPLPRVDPLRGPATTATGSAASHHSLAFAPVLPVFGGAAGVPGSGREQTVRPCLTLLGVESRAPRVYLELQGPCPAAPPAASSAGAGALGWVLGTWHSAVSSAPRSLGNHNGAVLP